MYDGIPSWVGQEVTQCTSRIILANFRYQCTFLKRHLRASPGTSGSSHAVSTSQGKTNKQIPSTTKQKKGFEHVDFFFFQVHCDKTNAQDQFTSQTVKLEKDKAGSASKTVLARNYANQLKAQVRTYVTPYKRSNTLQSPHQIREEQEIRSPSVTYSLVQ